MNERIKEEDNFMFLIKNIILWSKTFLFIFQTK